MRAGQRERRRCAGTRRADSRGSNKPQILGLERQPQKAADAASPGGISPQRRRPGENKKRTLRLGRVAARKGTIPGFYAAPFARFKMSHNDNYVNF